MHAACTLLFSKKLIALVKTWDLQVEHSLQADGKRGAGSGDRDKQESSRRAAGEQRGQQQDRGREQRAGAAGDEGG